MTGLLAALEGAPLAAHLRVARWSYALLNTGHVFGIALLFGAIAPLDLRLIGFWRDRPLAPLLAVLRPVAATGAVLAVATGLLLFAVRAREYAALPLFQVKMGLLALGLANALLLAGPRIEAAPPGRRRLIGAASLGLWAAVILCGRMLGYL